MLLFQAHRVDAELRSTTRDMYMLLGFATAAVASHVRRSVDDRKRIFSSCLLAHSTSCPGRLVLKSDSGEFVSMCCTVCVASCSFLVREVDMGRYASGAFQYVTCTQDLGLEGDGNLQFPVILWPG